MPTPVPSEIPFSKSPIVPTTTLLVVSGASNVRNTAKKWIIYVPVTSGMVVIGIIITAVVLLIFVGKNFYLKRQLKHALTVSIV